MASNPFIRMNYASECPPINKQVRRCMVCRKKLSRYNLNKYCFVHLLHGARLRQESNYEKVLRHARKQQAQRKAERRKRDDNKRRHGNDGVRQL